MQLQFPSSVRTVSLITALALAASGCATQVAVSPQGPVQNTVIASYNWGTLTYDNMPNDVPSVFDATKKALDNLHYFRVGEKNEPATGAPTKAIVYARGVQDVLVTVTIKPSKTAGLTELSVNLDPEDLPKTQAIYSEILRQLGGSPRASAPTPGFSAPARP